MNEIQLKRIGLILTQMHSAQERLSRLSEAFVLTGQSKPADQLDKINQTLDCASTELDDLYCQSVNALTEESIDIDALELTLLHSSREIPYCAGGANG